MVMGSGKHTGRQLVSNPAVEMTHGAQCDFGEARFELVGLQTFEHRADGS